MDDCQRIEDREIRFDIPRATASGNAVAVHTHEKDGMHRLMARTDDRHEVYFEVVTYPAHVDHREQYESHTAQIVANFDGAVVTELQSDTVLSLPASVFSFEGTNFSRRFLLIDSPVRTFRVVYDHHHALNEEIFATVRIGG